MASEKSTVEQFIEDVKAQFTISGTDFAEAARREAAAYQIEMASYLQSSLHP